jgi:hypothetical protein
MLWAVAGFYERWMPDPPQSRWAVAVFTFASGLGWLLPGSDEGFLMRQQSADLWMPEAVPFYAILVNPHFCISLAVMAHIATTVLGDTTGTVRRRDWLAVPAMLLLAFIHPFDTVTLGVLLIVTWLVLVLSRGARGSIPLRVALLTAPLPVLAYQAWVFQTHPTLAGWRKQNLAPSPDIWWYLTAYAPLMVMACLALLRPDSRRRLPRLVGVWLLLGLPLAYFPVEFQRRLIMGWTIPLAGATAVGIHGILRVRGARTPSLRCWAPVAIALLLAPTNLLLILRTVVNARAGSSDLYLRREEVEACEWLRANVSPGATVLTSPRLGLFVPALSGNRVLVGHWAASPDFFHLCGVANEFLSPNATPGYRSQVIRGYGVRWVLSDRGELTDASHIPLRSVFRRGDVVLYKAG